MASAALRVRPARAAVAVHKAKPPQTAILAVHQARQSVPQPAAITRPRFVPTASVAASLSRKRACLTPKCCKAATPPTTCLSAASHSMLLAATPAATSGRSVAAAVAVPGRATARGRASPTTRTSNRKRIISERSRYAPAAYRLLWFGEKHCLSLSSKQAPARTFRRGSKSQFGTNHKASGERGARRTCQVHLLL